jgi:predicted site-specific integrase-resolvase
VKANAQTDPGDSEAFYTLGEVIEILKVSRTTLWRWRNERGLCMVRIHGVIRIRKSDLGRFLNGGAE